jgi:hypothetical protein
MYTADLDCGFLNIPPVMVCVASHFDWLAQFERDPTASPFFSETERAPVEGRAGEGIV